MRASLMVALLALLPCAAEAHGYIASPMSRPFGCSVRQKVNTNCGRIQYEPQSVEGPDGQPERFPVGGAADGHIASGGARTKWQALNPQSATRWAKVPVRSGPTTFSWVFTAAHSTRDFRYWITKEGWNPDAPLARAQFEAEPFCTVELGGARAATNPSHLCNVPTRSGYHVILGVWDVADTGMSFYNVIDAIIDGTAAPPTAAPPTPRPTPRPTRPSTPQPPATPRPAPTPRPTWVATPQPPVTPQPPRTPRPVPTPRPTRAPGACIPSWEACGGGDDGSCCHDGTQAWYCHRFDRFYSQCLPTGRTPEPQVCEKRLGAWRECTGAANWSCCPDNWMCCGNEHYAQCVPSAHCRDLGNRLGGGL